MILQKPVFRRIAIALVSLVALLTVISAWEGLLHPETWWLLSITGLVFPYLFLLNLMLLMITILLYRKWWWIPGLAIVITIGKIPSVIQFNDPKKIPDYIEGQSDKIKFLSFNVRLFDLYNWLHNYDSRTRIFNFLGDQKAQIVCFQEFYSSDRDKMDNEHELMSVLGLKNYHIEYPVNRFTTDHYGIATYSKYPIINKGVLHLEHASTNICIYSDIAIKTDTIRVYNCHLQSVRFGTEDYKFLEDIRTTGQDTETIRMTRNILARLKKAFIRRARQSETIASHIASSPYPVIICGDFNDTALSYTYKVISDQLVDAFRESGRGLGSTYAGPIPGLRIDYILHSRELTSFGYRTHRVQLSDHFPIETTFVINP
jgi:endonuclease/exonuclease/phosphatase family metal-dependent hydrolase